MEDKSLENRMRWVVGFIWLMLFANWLNVLTLLVIAPILWIVMLGFIGYSLLVFGGLHD
jgi:hypothetical protein